MEGKAVLVIMIIKVRTNSVKRIEKSTLTDAHRGTISLTASMRIWSKNLKTLNQCTELQGTFILGIR